MNTIIYARVSTENQDNTRQVTELKDTASKEGFKIKKVFEDKITGATTAKSRTEFKMMLDYIHTNNINQIFCWELSRLGRSMVDIYNNIQNLYQQNLPYLLYK